MQRTTHISEYILSHPLFWDHQSITRTQHTPWMYPCSHRGTEASHNIQAHIPTHILFRAIHSLSDLSDRYGVAHVLQLHIKSRSTFVPFWHSTPVCVNPRLHRTGPHRIPSPASTGLAKCSVFFHTHISSIAIQVAFTQTLT